MQRRSFLGLGVAGGLSTMFEPSGILRASTPQNIGRAKHVIVVFEQGGVSHVDTWDPKPETPVDHRSPHKPIHTNVAGIEFTDLCAKTGRHADKLAVVRSMSHQISDHGAGTKYVLQGAKPGGIPEMPDLGTAVAHVIGTPCRYLPPYVMIPGNGEQSYYGPTHGFLSSAYKAFKTTGADLSKPDWRVADLGFLAGIDAERFHHRRDLLSNLDMGVIPGAAPPGRTRDMENYFQQAFDMLSNPLTQLAFDLTREPESVRDAYGRGHRGQCYLLSRRLVEAGARFVVLDVREPQTEKTPGGFNMNWDHHDAIYTSGSCGVVRDKAGGEGRYGIGHWVMMGSTDQAFATLLGDLDERGLLHETLVCFVTEFGRGPRLNQFGGRDHWPNAFSISFAGAGVRGGQVIGRTDRDGAYVQDQPYSFEDYAAVVYGSLGIDIAKPVSTRENRPVFLAHESELLSKLT